ncbi:pentapeptide repeat-containing protein [Listeria rocourtiae]|uniref:pentapeptide repeat-containing protein n=1 Tax=Listeria rocourtiae TaxID=647910 RepID=UPI003D2F6134
MKRRLLRADVQILLNNREECERITLTNCDLSKLDLSHLDLRNVDFSDSILDDTNLSNSDITHAVFYNTSINDARGLNMYAIHGISGTRESIYYHPATDQVWCAGTRMTLQNFKEIYAEPGEDYINEYALAEFQSTFAFFSSIECISKAREAEENSYFVDDYDAEEFVKEEAETLENQGKETIIIKSPRDLSIKGFEPLTKADEEAIKWTFLAGHEMTLDTETNCIMTKEKGSVAEVMMSALCATPLRGVL